MLELASCITVCLEVQIRGSAHHRTGTLNTAWTGLASQHANFSRHLCITTHRRQHSYHFKFFDSFSWSGECFQLEFWHIALKTQKPLKANVPFFKWIKKKSMSHITNISLQETDRLQRATKFNDRKGWEHVACIFTVPHKPCGESHRWDLAVLYRQHRPQPRDADFIQLPRGGVAGPC